MRDHFIMLHEYLATNLLILSIGPQLSLSLVNRAVARIVGSRETLACFRVHHGFHLTWNLRWTRKFPTPALAGRSHCLFFYNLHGSLIPFQFRILTVSVFLMNTPTHWILFVSSMEMAFTAINLMAIDGTTCSWRSLDWLFGLIKKCLALKWCQNTVATVVVMRCLINAKWTAYFDHSCRDAKKETRRERKEKSKEEKNQTNKKMRTDIANKKGRKKRER